jgi:hypothetical protein
MTVLSRCSCCKRRHFGKCPYVAAVIDLVKAYAEAVVKVRLSTTGAIAEGKQP